MRNEEMIINKGDFAVHYQPVIDIKTGNIVSAEALIRPGRRWTKDDTPSTLVSYAENNHIINRLDMYVLTQVCDMISGNDLSGSDLTFHVNISPVELNEDIIKNIRDITDTYNIPYNQIMFEVLETKKMLKNQYVILEKLKSYGFKTAIDDYGVGYSSVQRLTEFDFECVKISRPMLCKALLNDQYMYMYRKIVEGLAFNDVEIIQEGVETLSQFEFVKNTGVTLIQGFYTSKAVPEAQFIKLLRTNMLVRNAS